MPRVPAELRRAADALNDKQRALVHNIVERGLNQTDAAIEAGYSEKSARIHASQTLSKPHVAEYMRLVISQHLNTAAGIALGKIGSLIQNAKSEYVQLEAARDVLDRAGFRPPDRKQVQVDGTVSVEIDLR